MPTHIYSLRTKMTLSFVLVLTLAVALIGITSYIAGKKLLKECMFSKLSSICTIKDGQIEQYLGMLQDQCLSMSESTMTVQAMEALRTGFNALHVSQPELATYKQTLQKFYTEEFLPRLNKTAQTPRTLNDYFPIDEQTVIAQTWYIAENPQPVQKKVEYLHAPNESPYNTAHELYHPIFRRYAQRVGIADLYLVDIATGHVIYSLAKEIDFGTNLLSGPLKETGLGRSFLELQKTNDVDFIKIIDFQFYDPSYGTPVGFISTPIFSQGTKIGGLIFKFPIDSINDIMTYNKRWHDVGLGKTGESFLIGPDKTMRTIARQYIEDPTTYIKLLREHEYDGATLDKIQVYDTTVLLKKTDLEIIGDVLSGKKATVITTDTMGVEVIYSYAPVQMGDIHWYILVKMSTREAFEPIQTLLWYLIICSLLVILLSASILFGFIVVVTKPLAEMIHLFNGNTSTITQKLSIDNTAEFGAIGEAYNRMIEHIKTVVTRITTLQEQLERMQQSTLKQTGDLIHGTNTVGEHIKQTQNQLDGITALYKEEESLDQQETAYNAQVITLANLIDTTQETLIQYIDEICKAIDAQETAQAVRICTSIAPLIINARNSCKQIISLFGEIGTKQEQKNEIRLSTTRVIRDLSALMNQLERNRIDAQSTLKRIQKTQQEQATITKQLETVTQEIKQH